MERREFLKNSCSLCIALGAGVAGLSLTSCAPFPVYQANVVRNDVAIPLTAFTQSALQIIRAPTLMYDIALHRNGSGIYKALLLRCTHADSQVDSTGQGYVCVLHGSKFDMDGVVTQGPAQTPLEHLTTDILDEHIIIHLRERDLQ